MTQKSLKRSKISTADLRKDRYTKAEMNQEFYQAIEDIITHPEVLKMRDYIQHCDTDCYEHCLEVAYNNFCICKKLGLDARSAARGGMLHDLFLYDWRLHSKKTGDRLHAITHPVAAYHNASKLFRLNDVEKEVIAKHMWPVSVFLPRHAETYVICLTDKYCGSREIAQYYASVMEKKIWSRPIGRVLHKIFSKIPSVRKQEEIWRMIIQEVEPELSSIDKGVRPESFAQQRRRKSSDWGQISGKRRRSR